MKLVEQIGLVTNDPREKRLKLEPSRQMASYLFPRGECDGVIDLYRHARGFGEQLRLASSFHRNEPPNCRRGQAGRD